MARKIKEKVKQIDVATMKILGTPDSVVHNATISKLEVKAIKPLDPENPTQHQDPSYVCHATLTNNLDAIKQLEGKFYDRIDLQQPDNTLTKMHNATIISVDTAQEITIESVQLA